MEAAALSDAALAEFGKKVVLFCHNTSRVDGDKDPKLLQEKGGNAFPYLVFMDAEGTVLAKQRTRTVAGFEATLERLNKRTAMAKKAAAGDQAAKVDLLIVDVELGALEFAKAEEQAKGLSMSPEQKATWDQLGVEAEVSAAMSAGRGRAASPDAAKDMAAKFKTMKAAGRIPKGDTATSFWMTLANAAVTDGDAKAAEEAYAEVEKLAERNPALKQRALPELRKKIDALKTGGDKKDG